ncbi:hypothetical protein Syun_030637 [Stephania yunnanensis]|uniref:Uncharacterized protein n=1 Tax=Stephania yunnanensis TaxID=152371 RepID=A0AAP0DUI7_9MAGN
MIFLLSHSSWSSNLSLSHGLSSLSLSRSLISLTHGLSLLGSPPPLLSPVTGPGTPEEAANRRFAHHSFGRDQAVVGGPVVARKVAGGLTLSLPEHSATLPLLTVTGNLRIRVRSRGSFT